MWHQCGASLAVFGDGDGDVVLLGTGDVLGLGRSGAASVGGDVVGLGELLGAVIGSDMVGSWALWAVVGQRHHG